MFVDFDGTIATQDTTDLLLERFADPRWHQIEDEWRAGRIGSRECMVRQIDLVRVSPRALDAFLEEIEIDPNFPAFTKLCQALGFPLTVLSDGLDRAVRMVLDRAALDLPIRANHLRWLGGERWTLDFPYARSGCAALAGNCKCHIAEASRSPARILVGDGRSDFCLAGRVDLVLAKGSLLRHCREQVLPHVGFDGFAQACDVLLAWLGEPRTAADHV